MNVASTLETCINGHPRIPENVLVTINSGREVRRCRSCKRDVYHTRKILGPLWTLRKLCGRHDCGIYFHTKLPFKKFCSRRCGLIVAGRKWHQRNRRKDRLYAKTWSAEHPGADAARARRYRLAKKIREALGK